MAQSWGTSWGVSWAFSWGTAGGGPVDPYLLYYNSRRKRTPDAVAKRKAIRKRRGRR